MTHYIPTNFEGKGEVKGFTFTQVEKSEKMYLYKVKYEGFVYYELFEIRTAPLCVNFENREYSDTEFREVYPKANDFGVWAWTFRDLKDAKKRMI
jgi:hypothetical protein